MARSEARVSVDIWSPESDFTTLTPGAQWMYFLLLSQKDLAHTGVIALRERRWSRSAAGMTVDLITAHLVELEAARYVVIDHGTEELLVRSLIRRDKVYKQPNVLRAAADHLPLIASDAIRQVLAVELARIANEPMPDGSRTIIEEMRRALPDPSGEPTPNPSGNPSDMPTPGTPGVRGVVTAVSNDFPVPRSPKSPDPGTTSSSPRADEPRERRRAGERIPDDFEATPEMIEWAREHTPDVGARETAAFVDYWRSLAGPKARKLDWPATWRNWMRRAQDDLGTRRNGHARASPADRPATSDIRAAQALAAGEAVQAELDRRQIAS